MMTATELLKPLEVCALLKICESSLYLMVGRGAMPNPVELPAVRGRRGHKRWRREDIQQWLDLGCPCRADFERLKK